MSKNFDISLVKNRVINGKFKIIVKPNSKHTEITSIDLDVIRISLKAKPVDNEANLEVVKYFSKLLKQKVRIKTGLKNREKVLEIIS